MGNNRVILVIPGVTGCSDDKYVQEFVGKSIRNGYSVAVLNHLAPKNELTSHMRLIDFSDPETMHNAYNFVKK